MLCHRCGTFFAAGAQFCPGCGLAIPTRPVPSAAQAVNVSAPAGPRYAGFWRRCAALVIDRLLLTTLVIVMGLFYRLLAGGGQTRNDLLLLSLISLIFGFLLRWLYYTLLESSSLQATPGKLIMGALVTDEQGGRISLARANGRYWAKMISSMTLGIGYLMTAFTARKQALHDVIATTLVIRK